jgi:hypothetical protein
MSEFNKFEEYKFIVEDTARMTDRRQNISNLYTTVNSILLAAIAVMFTETSLPSIVIIAGSVVIMIAGVAIAIAWKRAILNYRNLLQVRFDILYEIEKHPAMADSEKMYHREARELYPRDEEGKPIETKGLFSNIEKQLPEIFIALYVILTITIALAAVTGVI